MKVSGLRFTAFTTQTEIKFTQGEKVLKFFKTLVQNRAFLQGMHVSRTKISNVVKNVSSPHEKEST